MPRLREGARQGPEEAPGTLQENMVELSGGGMTMLRRRPTTTNDKNCTTPTQQQQHGVDLDRSSAPLVCQAKAHRPSQREENSGGEMNRATAWVFFFLAEKNK
jgi:hypothetical protein